MSDEIRVNRPAQPTVSQPAMQAEATAAPSSSKKPWVILGAIVVVLIILAIIFRSQLFGKSKNGQVLGATTTAYQAVFLTNGQVYFGRLSDASKDYVTLTDIYYLQVGPTQGSGAATTTPGQEIHLVKLGQELHGPVDQMHISRSQVLFYEDLKDDGQVVQAILRDKNASKK